MNEIANLAEQWCVDIEEIKDAILADGRVGHEYLDPGCGFGGRTLTTDLSQMEALFKENSTGARLLSAARRSNNLQQEVLFRKAWRRFSGNLKGKRIAIWGCAFKPNTASVAHSPALSTLESLWGQEVTTIVHDPRALSNLQQTYSGEDLLRVAETPIEAAAGTDAVFIMTAWRQYMSVDLEELHAVMKTPIIFDGRNLFEPGLMKELGFEYHGIGR